MPNRWCDKADVLDQVPEFRSDSEAGVLDDATVNRLIEQATQIARGIVAGRFLLATIDAGITAGTLRAISDLVAIRTGILLLTRHQMGKNGAVHLADLRKELKSRLWQISAGTLYYDDGTKVVSRNGPAAVAPGIPDSLGVLYDDGDRYAQPT